jgi:hypothetical protein
MVLHELDKLLTSLVRAVFIQDVVEVEDNSLNILDFFRGLEYGIS